MPTAVTDGVRVTVESFYLADRSDPDEQAYAFAYVVTIGNEGDVPVQLRRRHWVITDGNGAVREVEGPGVVGEEPVIAPGAAHRYTSGAVLPTPVGTMEGTYEMHRPNGEIFQATIPLFPLRCPGVVQ